ncbi:MULTISPECIES: cysteine desulfuration protein SufE [Proteus]|uniref:Cysteine desulfuration protein SufE n=1 Tax=Proteus penneri TaxID=102862 RepID=A0ABS0VZ22_9GAMM|nr:MULTISPECIES: cysteine desulfuration protein SufE [Proteus]MBJ2116296.1 cysteine desulfuration protein SufE [Proteus penneri]NBM13316.1 cysteine desulfuration protein SufE [Proteus sp. G2670]NBM32853.1 cysteine desulfuration protein SufE [Proteus sp. G2664]NBM87822.1 cysteine desulfuration protein SufE [Proteus sp. G2661]NBM98759.1 cysteine desulfuration protein SufE [Proteus sp. G2660]
MAVANLPDEAKLLRNFSRCQDWEQRYLYMMELGERLPPLTDEQRISANFIEGCQSQVWIAVSLNESKQLILSGDSDAGIVKGLVALVIILFQGKTVEQALATDVKHYFSSLALESHLTPSRTQGLHAMVTTLVKRFSEYAVA